MSVPCARCGRNAINREDFISRVDGDVYHLECFPEGHVAVSIESLSPKASEKINRNRRRKFGITDLEGDEAATDR